MKAFLKNKKQLIAFGLIILTSSLGIFVLGTNEAKAVDLGIVDGAMTLGGNFLLMVQGGVGWIIAQLAGLAQGLLDYTKLQNAPIVEKGWTTIRDLVNMFFVLAILVIAFATILQLETYGMKALLTKLVIAALLINFSLVIAGVFVDFSGVLTNFFIQDSEQFFKDIGDQIGLPHIQRTNAEVEQQYWQSCNLAPFVDPDCTGHFKTKGECKTNTPLMKTCIEKKTNEVDWDAVIKSEVYWEVIKSLLFSIAFAIIAAFVFGALAFFLLVRILAVWFLLILAPLAWFFWILPATKGLFTKWWDNFIKWVFFAPAAVFFIWLSIESWTGFVKGQLPFAGEKIVGGVSKVITDEVLKTKIIPEVMEPSYFVQFLLACGLLIGSLIVAQSMSIYGAKGAIELGQKWSKGIAGGTGRGIQRLGTRPADATQRGLNRASTWMRNSRLARWTGVSNLVGQASRIPGMVGGKERAAYPKAEEKYKNWTTDSMKARFRLVNSQEKVAIAKILAEKGALEANDSLGFSNNDIEKVVKYSKKYGKHKDILKARPDLASSIGEDIGKIIEGIEPKDIEKIQAMSLDKNKVGEKHAEQTINAIIKQLSPGGKWRNNHLSKMAESNQSLAAMMVDENILKNNFDRFREDIKKYLRGDVAKTIFGDTEPPKQESFEGGGRI